MKIFSLVLAATAFLTGCASQEQVANKQMQFAQAQNDLHMARVDSPVKCADRKSCDKAFSLAKVFVQQHSDMKIQISDDAMVSTFNPTQYTMVGLSALKVPGSGDSSKIQLTVSCKGMESVGAFYTECAQRSANLYRNFKSYVESRLN